jgi:gluconolactonase
MSLNFELVHGPLARPIGGLAWDGAGMLFSDLNNSAILRYDPAKKAVTTWRKYTNRVNGIAFAPNGALYGCQEGSRRVIQFLPDGSATATATQLDGRVHNFPRYVTVDKHGHAWFSDTHHTIVATGPQLFPRLEHQSILRVGRGAKPRPHWHLERMTYDTLSPRGVALAPDEKTLYVADTDNRAGGVRELRAYPVEADGTLGPHVVLHTFGADRRGVHRGIEGLCVDADGNIIACAGWKKSGPGPLIYVFAPSGAVIETHALPVDNPVNCAFGDADLSSLYVGSEDGSLLRAQKTGRRGHLVFPKT